MDLDYQRSVIKTHADKAIECIQGAEFDEAIVHLEIAKIVRDGLIAVRVEQESLNNLAQSL